MLVAPALESIHSKSIFFVLMIGACTEQTKNGC